MSKIAYSSGGCGDIIFQIPALKELEVETVIMPQEIYNRMHRLLEYVGFECIMKNSPEFAHFNMDDFRKQPRRGVNHIMVSIANQFGTKQPDFEPWLKVEPYVGPNPYELVHVTSRWREGSKVDWRSVLVDKILGKKIFVGLPDEYYTFQNETGILLPHYHSKDIFELSEFVSGASYVYCNQSVVMALCQAMGKEYYGEFKPGKSNCRTYRSNEHVL